MQTRSVFITGSTGDLGKALVDKFLQEGHQSIILHGRNEAKLHALHTKITEAYPTVKVETVCADLTNIAAIEELNRFLATKDIAYFIMNAGYMQVGDFQKVTQDVLHNHLLVNTYAPTMLIHQLVRKNSQLAEKTHIIIIASMAGFMEVPQANLYFATKHYLKVFGRMLHEELSNYKSMVTVTTVCPGFLDTQMVEHNLTKKGRILIGIPLQTLVNKVYRQRQGQKSILLLSIKDRIMIVVYRLTPRFIIRYLLLQANKQLLNSTQEPKA